MCDAQAARWGVDLLMHPGPDCPCGHAKRAHPTWGGPARRCGVKIQVGIGAGRIGVECPCTGFTELSADVLGPPKPVITRMVMSNTMCLNGCSVALQMYGEIFKGLAVFAYRSCPRCGYSDKVDCRPYYGWDKYNPITVLNPGAVKAKVDKQT